MPTDVSEKQLETILVDYPRDIHGYEQGVSEDYSKDYALDTARAKRFLLSTQKKKVEVRAPGSAARARGSCLSTKVWTAARETPSTPTA